MKEFRIASRSSKNIFSEANIDHDCNLDADVIHDHSTYLNKHSWKENTQLIEEVSNDIIEGDQVFR